MTARNSTIRFSMLPDRMIYSPERPSKYRGTDDRPSLLWPALLQKPIQIRAQPVLAVSCEPWEEIALEHRACREYLPRRCCPFPSFCGMPLLAGLHVAAVIHADLCFLLRNATSASLMRHEQLSMRVFVQMELLRPVEFS